MTQYEVVARMLQKFGGFYLVEDIIDLVRAGKMQSFVLGDSWAVTQICEYPRRRALDIVFMVGNKDELELLETDLIGFAREHDIDYMTANGRKGFIKKAYPGWNLVSATFVKDLT